MGLGYRQQRGFVHLAERSCESLVGEIKGMLPRCNAPGRLIPWIVSYPYELGTGTLRGQQGLSLHPQSSALGQKEESRDQTHSKEHLTGGHMGKKARGLGNNKTPHPKQDASRCQPQRPIRKPAPPVVSYHRMLPAYGTNRKLPR